MATIYVSPTGGGQGNGSSASNALPATSLDQAIQLAGPGGTVVMLADKGAYNISGTITISHGGTDGAPVTIMGADSAGHAMDITINGTRDATWTAGDADGNQIFRLLNGANNLNFSGMDFNNVGTGFVLGGNLKNVTIQNMEADNVRYFINNLASGDATEASVNGLTIKDVEVHGFSKSVVLLKYDTHNVTIDNVYGDSEYQDGDHFAMGILLDGTVHDAVISDSTMKNAIGSDSTGAYWNGDGFTTEEGVYNVRFENDLASGNADGGFDLKSTNTLLVNCTADDNKRNFRLWGEAELDNCTGIDPHLRGGTGSQDQIWVANGAHVTVVGGYFSDSGSNTKVVYSDGGTISFNDTSFWYASNSMLTAGSGISGIDGSLLNSIKSSGSWSTTGEQYLPVSGGSNPAPTPEPDPAPAPDPTPDPTPGPSLAISSTTVEENAADGTCLGYVSIANAKGAVTYSLADDGNGCFTIDPTTGEITVVNGNLLDFETASKTTIVVQASTAGGSVSQSFDIGILNENDAPDGLSVVGGTVAENVPAGTLVATVTGHDPDAGDSVSYSLSQDGGGRFVIDPKSGAITVATGAVLDYEQQHNYAITVVVTDSQGLTYSEAISIGIKDVVDSIVRQTVNGTNRGDTIGPFGDANYTVNALRGNDQVTTGAGADIIVGGGGDDHIFSGAGNDSIRFSGTADGFDWVDGGSGFDVIEAMARGTIIGLHALEGIERISANGFADVVVKGSSVADTLDFSNVEMIGIARISGGTGNDTLTGSAGDDVIYGDGGADRLAGGAGSDIFGFASRDSVPPNHDTIVDFAPGVDRIDLGAVDAIAKMKGNQAFTFIGSDAFSGAAGELRVDMSDPNVTHVCGDTNGDGITDFQIDLIGSIHLQASDFIL